jgi:membrane associated rhomboid family serine protease
MLPRVSIRKPRAQVYYFTNTQQLKTCFNQWRERPLFIWFISIIQIVVFIAELGISWSLTGTPIQIKPSFNPLIGPSVYVLINMGARFPPCMQEISGITDNSLLGFPCPNYTGLIEQEACNLSQLCGFSFSTSPNQWYRFIIPVFLHGGLVHIGVNLFGQFTLGASVEKKIGTLRLAVIYFASGIFGNIVGGNFAPKGLATVGCSGSLFGIIALTFLNILYDWHSNSCCQIIILIIGVVIDLGVGLLPLIDNFAHIGGFVMGFLLGLALLTSPITFRRRKEIYRDSSTEDQGKFKRFFYNRPGKWWMWWVLRFIFLTVTILIFVLSIQNVYSRMIHCTWCQYFDCLPINGWCNIGYFQTSATMSSTLTTYVNTTI